MRKILSVVLLWMAVLPVLCQSPTPKYQPGTITAVKAHQDKEARRAGRHSLRYFRASRKHSLRHPIHATTRLLRRGVHTGHAVAGPGRRQDDYV